MLGGSYFGWSTFGQGFPQGGSQPQSYSVSIGGFGSNPPGQMYFGEGYPMFGHTATSQSIPGVARIQVAVQRTLTAKARIQRGVLKTYPATSRISVVAIRAQPAKCRITATTQRNISGVCRIITSHPPVPVVSDGNDDIYLAAYAKRFERHRRHATITGKACIATKATKKRRSRAEIEEENVRRMLVMLQTAGAI